MKNTVTTPISGTFKSHDGIHDISYRVFKSNTNVRGIVQLSHGMCEHIGRYSEFAEYLTSHGFAVCGNDHLGHGESAASTDELGYFSKDNGWQNAVGDLHTLTSMMKDEYPTIPYFIFGHSMGSFLARAYSARYGDGLSGAVFCGTSGGVPAMGAQLRLISTISALRGDRYRSEWLYRTGFRSYTKRIPGLRTDQDWLSRDEGVVDRYIADERCMFKFTANGYENLMGVLRHVSSKEWYSAYSATLPTLIISGDMDPVGDYGKGPTKVFRRLSDGGCDVRLHLYSGARHELLNETNRAEVYRDLAAFFESCI